MRSQLKTHLLLIFITVSISLLLSGCNKVKPDSEIPETISPEIKKKYDPVILKWAGLFSPSALTFEQRCEELAWFREQGALFKGTHIRSVGEDIETTFWESQYLTRAFQELTGINVVHNVIGEGLIVDRLMEQLEGGIDHYDIYVSDADLIGTHLRMNWLVTLSDYIQNEGKSYTNPYLDLDDFLNLEFGQDYEGRQLQIPNYQFSLVYWFRYDWFTDPDIMQEFREIHGYELGVPLNWAAYEDIAKFFTGRKMKNPNDSEVIAYGHADYALPGPWLGWRFSDAFMSIAGMGDVGLPNGQPVDEWGIRVENKIPVGASVERGGAINGPAAVYALTKWLEFLNSYAPEKCYNLDWLGLGPVPARGDIAQTWYWTYIYASLNSEYNKIGSPVCDKEGNPVWRIAPVPQGRYWQPGMKIGYQDAGSWTLPKMTTGAKRHAAWIWAQFCLSKTVALKKFEISATPIRKSTLYSDYISEKMDKFGGLIEFTRSPMIKKFTDSGPNVPHYPRMSKLWWQNIATAVSEQKTPQQALNRLAEQMDELMASLKLNQYSPQLNEKRPPEAWLSKDRAPKAVRTERPAPKTCSYDDLLKQWKQENATN